MRYILHSYRDTVVVTVTMHNKLRENKASSNRFHESFWSVVLQAAETYLNQNTRHKLFGKMAIAWNSWYFPIYFTIFTPFEKKNVVSLYLL